ncbi:venom peptide SjAPI-2-like [Vespa mandarinia]|uniref:venom peptide SjAPI-2-like n=1 Tax=Vespa mandarinia TaxID=7446 RepID=UPI001615CE74|nr:venom peptide SjAPI-2-like [Vespa mandarinia]
MSRVTTIIFILALCISSIVYISACGSNAICTDCASTCPLTCENYNNPPKICSDICRKGCECINGYIFNSEGECVLPSEC